jgi:hypothetical protein
LYGRDIDSSFFFFFHLRVLHPVACVMWVAVNAVYAKIVTNLPLFVFVLSIATCFCHVTLIRQYKSNSHDNYSTYKLLLNNYDHATTH